MAERKKKENSRKADTFLKVVTSLVVASLGVWGPIYLHQRQKDEMRTRLYTELMSSRETSETALRKDMLSSIMETFFTSDSGELDTRLLNLELMAYNFHESLNLKPLFLDLKRRIEISEQERKGEFLERLVRSAKEISGKQMMILESVGKAHGMELEMAADNITPSMFEFSDTLIVKNHKTIVRETIVHIIEVDTSTNEVEVGLEINMISREDDGAIPVSTVTSFSVSFFDFPMIDNLRLPYDQRCAVVLRKFGPQKVELTTVYFPGSYASLKEKPYYEDVIENLKAFD